MSTMRYAQIRELDISNGIDVGVSLFTQGCRKHCKGCHNQEQWSFDGGQEFTIETQNEILELLDRPYISRFSILGGEPLEPQNIIPLYDLLDKIKKEYPDIQIWLYTGMTMHEIAVCGYSMAIYDVLSLCDIIIEGPYIEKEKDISLAFRGSKNQKILKVLDSASEFIWKDITNEY